MKTPPFWRFFAILAIIIVSMEATLCVFEVFMDKSDEVVVLKFSDLGDDWEQVGGFLRRCDASPKKPSPLLSISDVVRLARVEILELRGGL
jgi:hypothetical protein